MFFFAFFGIQDKEKQIGTRDITCPSCGREARCEIYKAYRYFHIFLIPIARWNLRYFAKTSCCGAFYELGYDAGREFERNPNTEIRTESLHRGDTPFRHCPNCNTDLPAKYSFCPYCGGKL